MDVSSLTVGIVLAGGSPAAVPVVPATDWAIVAAATEDAAGCYMVAELPTAVTLAIGVWREPGGDFRLTLALQHDGWKPGAGLSGAATVRLDGQPAASPASPEPLPSGTGIVIPLMADPDVLDRLAAGARLDVLAGDVALAVDLSLSGPSFLDTLRCAAAEPESESPPSLSL